MPATWHLPPVPFGGRDAKLRSATLQAMAASDRPRRLARLRDLIPAADIDALLGFSERNRVAPVVAHALLEAYPDGFSSSSACAAIHGRSAYRMSVFFAELDAIADRLRAAGIAVVALKNGGIARGLYPCPGCCPMGDIDLLVTRRHFRKAHEILLECGFDFATRSTVEPAELSRAEKAGGSEHVKRVEGEELWIELQWRSVAGRWIRIDQETSSDDLLARSSPIPGTAVRLLDPVDNMLQVCLHTAKHSFVRAPGLRLHTDVDRLATFAPPLWDSVVAEATRLRIRTPVFFSLALAQVLLDSPVPHAVLGALAPSAFRRRVVGGWIWQADVFNPDSPKFSRPAMLALHSLLCDDLRGLLASAFGVRQDDLSLRTLPRYARSASHRLLDIATRYERSTR